MAEKANLRAQLRDAIEDEDAKVKPLRMTRGAFWRPDPADKARSAHAATGSLCLHCSECTPFIPMPDLPSTLDYAEDGPWAELRGLRVRIGDVSLDFEAAMADLMSPDSHLRKAMREAFKRERTTADGK